MIQQQQDHIRELEERNSKLMQQQDQIRELEERKNALTEEIAQLKGQNGKQVCTIQV